MTSEVSMHSLQNNKQSVCFKLQIKSGRIVLRPISSVPLAVLRRKYFQPSKRHDLPVSFFQKKKRSEKERTYSMLSEIYIHTVDIDVRHSCVFLDFKNWTVETEKK